MLFVACAGAAAGAEEWARGRRRLLCTTALPRRRCRAPALRVAHGTCPPTGLGGQEVRDGRVRAMGGRVVRVRGDDLRLPARATRRQLEAMFLYFAGLRAPSVLVCLSTFVLWFVLFSGALCVCLSQRGPYPAPVPFAGSFQFNSIVHAVQQRVHKAYSLSPWRMRLHAVRMFF